MPKPMNNRGKIKTIIDNKRGKITEGISRITITAETIAKIIFKGNVIRKIPAFRPKIRTLKKTMPIKSNKRIPNISMRKPFLPHYVNEFMKLQKL
jgi:hypothetical protein